jgi:hypothetical protein
MTRAQHRDQTTFSNHPVRRDGGSDQQQNEPGYWTRSVPQFMARMIAAHLSSWYHFVRGD